MREPRATHKMPIYGHHVKPTQRNEENSDEVKVLKASQKITVPVTTSKVRSVRPKIDTPQNTEALERTFPFSSLPTYPCWMCPKIFSSDYTLRLHMRHHFGTQLRCPERNCEFETCYDSSLKKHLVLRHGTAEGIPTGSSEEGGVKVGFRRPFGVLGPPFINTSGMRFRVVRNVVEPRTTPITTSYPPKQNGVVQFDNESCITPREVISPPVVISPRDITTSRGIISPRYTTKLCDIPRDIPLDTTPRAKHYFKVHPAYITNIPGSRDQPRANLKTTPKIYVCPFCSLVYLDRITIDGHLQSHAPHEPYQCPLCPFSAHENAVIRRHVNGTHVARDGKRILKFLPLHYGLHPRVHVCGECGKSYSDKYTLSDHFRTHNGNLLRCPECEFVSPYRSNIRAHLKVHLDRKVT